MMNSTKSSDIERTVMRRVHRARIVRAFISGGALAALVLAVALWGVGREVWVAHVLQNAPNAGVLSLGRFYLSAFEHTNVTVQALVLASAAAALVFARSLARPVAGVFKPSLA